MIETRHETFLYCNIELAIFRHKIITFGAEKSIRKSWSRDGIWEYRLVKIIYPFTPVFGKLRLESENLKFISGIYCYSFWCLWPRDVNYSSLTVHIREALVVVMWRKHWLIDKCPLPYIYIKYSRVSFVIQNPYIIGVRKKNDTGIHWTQFIF